MAPGGAHHADKECTSSGWAFHSVSSDPSAPGIWRQSPQWTCKAANQVANLSGGWSTASSIAAAQEAVGWTAGSGSGRSAAASITATEETGGFLGFGRGWGATASTAATQEAAPGCHGECSLKDGG